MSTYKFKTNINCNNCIQTVTPFLNELDNLDSWRVNIEDENKILEVILDNEDHKTVEDAVTKAGFTINMV